MTGAPPRWQRLAPGELPRHRHDQPYAAVVLAGGYEEAGDHGRRRVEAGDVLVHGAFEAHLNRVGRGGEVLNLPLPWVRLAPFGRIADPDLLARLAHRDPAEAALMLAEAFRRAPLAPPADWMDLLAADLAEAAPPPLAEWGERHGLAPAQVSRGFRMAYGVSPQRFRWEARARAAVRALCASRTPLAELALDLGFSDQAHMTRVVAAFTGRTPGAWRKAPA